ncbi:hypothetical protein VHEMI03473 [[Torrubiella] hemipterigena]|uniref:Uncharacterized protein n=1 Tax=[Torrubiella] hemipterigena TaxID=1531966 RepID=A0A0A1SSL1_9HYPO|nr:hypothetical protein VHEMI03473 [[Torrubiella] hemipterigena]
MAAPTGPAINHPSNDYRLAFLYDQNAPQSLVGSVISAATKEFEEREATLLVTCASPCPTSVNFPQQTITHRSGSIWEGQYAVSGTTTSWGCDLGSGAYVTQGKTIENGRNCTHVTVGPSGNTLATATETLAECDVDARSKMLFVTAGLDEWRKVESTPKKSPEEQLSAYSSALKSKGCTATTTPVASPAGATTLPKGESGSQPTTQATASPSSSRSAAQQTKLGPLLLVSAVVLGVFNGAL